MVRPERDNRKTEQARPKELTQKQTCSRVRKDCRFTLHLRDTSKKEDTNGDREEKKRRTVPPIRGCQGKRGEKLSK